MKLSLILNESLNGAKARFGNNPDFDKLLPLDTSKTFKYIEWIAAKFYSEEKPKIEDIKRYILKFDHFANRNKIQQKDINQYKTFADFKKAIDALGETEVGEVETEVGEVEPKEKPKKYDFHKLMENDFVIINVPHCWEASKHLAKGATWCTASSSPMHWNSYIIKNGGKLYYIEKKDFKKNDIDRMTAVLVQKNGERSFWDYQDNCVTNRFDRFLKANGDIDKKIFERAPFTPQEGQDQVKKFENELCTVYLALSQDFVASYFDDFFHLVYGENWGNNGWGNRRENGDEGRFFTKYKPYIIVDKKNPAKTTLYLIKEGYDYIDIFNTKSKALSKERNEKQLIIYKKEYKIPREALRSTRSISYFKNKDFRTAHQEEVTVVFENKKVKVITPKTFEAFQVFGTKRWYSEHRGAICRDSFDFAEKILGEGNKILIAVDKADSDKKFAVVVRPPSGEDSTYNPRVRVHEKKGGYWNQPDLSRKIAEYGIPKEVFDLSKEDIMLAGGKLKDIRLLQKGVKEKVSIDIRDENGMTPVQYAFRNIQKYNSRGGRSQEDIQKINSVLEYLKKQKANFEIVDEKGNDLIHLVFHDWERFADLSALVDEAEGVRGEEVREILKTHMNRQDKNGMTIFHKMFKSPGFSSDNGDGYSSGPRPKFETDAKKLKALDSIAKINWTLKDNKGGMPISYLIENEEISPKTRFFILKFIWQTNKEAISSKNNRGESMKNVYERANYGRDNQSSNSEYRHFVMRILKGVYELGDELKDDWKEKEEDNQAEQEAADGERD